MEEEIKKEIIGKAGFPLYVDYWDKYFLKMTGDQVKEVLKIIYHFNKTFEVLETNDLAVDMVIATIIDNLKRDAEKRIKQSKASRANGKNGGRPKKEPEGGKPKKTQKNPEEPNGLLVDEDNQFELFWQSYKPIHTSKGNKEKSKALFLKALKTTPLESIAKGLNAYMSHCQSKNSYTKSVEVWLRNQCWNDEYSTAREQPKGKVAELRDVFQQFLDQDDE